MVYMMDWSYERYIGRGIRGFREFGKVIRIFSTGNICNMSDIHIYFETESAVFEYVQRCQYRSLLSFISCRKYKRASCVTGPIFSVKELHNLWISGKVHLVSAISTEKHH